MAVKLALDDKQEILRLYRESDATTTYLAKQFGISTSTVLRLLQELIPAEEYRLLVSQKKADGKRGSRVSHEFSNFQINQLALLPDDLPTAKDVISSSFDQDDDEIAIAMDDQQQLNDQIDRAESILEELEDDDLEIDDQEAEDDLNLEADEDDLDLEADDDLLDEAEDDLDLEAEDDLVDEDNLDLDDEIDFPEEDGDASLAMFAELHGNHSAGERLEILPLDKADLPLICYIVVDRIAEIITRPLKDFKDLGTIPIEESLSKTIPVFDNHRVARRFSHHNQRVIKFPSDLIHITRPKLVQKGITRILFSGQVYTLC